MKSWKTTTTGVVSILIAVLSAFGTMIDSDVTTNPDWAAVAAAIIAGVGLIMARDNSVTSERAGAK